MRRCGLTIDRGSMPWIGKREYEEEQDTNARHEQCLGRYNLLKKGEPICHHYFTIL